MSIAEDKIRAGLVSPIKLSDPVVPEIKTGSLNNTKNSFFKNQNSSRDKVLVTEVDSERYLPDRTPFKMNAELVNPKSATLNASVTKEKVRYDLIKIWSNLSQEARRELLEHKLDEAELFVNTKKTLKELMQNFSL
jgi:hypothetical protein